MNNNSYQNAVKNYVDNLSILENVQGVILTGSAGRGDRDDLSDVDNIVLVDNKKDVIEGKFNFHEFIFDTRITDFGEVTVAKWSQDMYFAYLNCKIAYDRNNKIKLLIEQKKREWEDNIVKYISLKLVNLSVIFLFADNWKNLKADTHFEKFIRRKDYISAQKTLNLGLEQILDLLYLVNKKTIPDAKNKIKLMKNLRWLPFGSDKTINESMLVKSISEKDSIRRYELIIKYIEEIKIYIDNNFILDNNLYKYYLDSRGL